MTARDRAHFLAAGTWPRGNGTVVRLAQMHPAHLVNAYLAALAAGDPKGVTRPLGEAVVARGLGDAALAEAERRSRK